MASATRSKVRSNGTQLSGPLVIHKKTFKCIICTRGFHSKAWVRRHYRTHDNIPYRMDNEGEKEFLPAFTDPSCWPAAETMTWDRLNALTNFKEAAKSIDSADATPSELSAWIINDHMEEIGALTPREYRAKELQKLRRWHWWWEAQQGAVVDHVEHGTAGDLQINGDAGFEDQQSRWGNAARTVHNFPPVLPISWDPRNTDFRSKPASRERANAMTWYPRDGEGRLYIEIDINENKLMKLPTMMQCLSLAITHATSKHGETDLAGRMIGRATATYLRMLRSDTYEQEHRENFDEAPQKIDESMEKRRSVLFQANDGDAVAQQTMQEQRETTMRHDFRVDRGNYWDYLYYATDVYFFYNEAGTERELKRFEAEEAELVKAGIRFARLLDDKETWQKLEAFSDGEGALDEILDRQFGVNMR
ncbi:MAG: hypothetical protein Q9195_000217 [Heterodermia aff. obscurata]